MADLHVPTLAAEPLFEIAGWPITNSVIGTWIAMVVLIAILWAGARKPQLVPGHPQSALEQAIDGIRGVVNATCR